MSMIGGDNSIVFVVYMYLNLARDHFWIHASHVHTLAGHLLSCFISCAFGNRNQLQPELMLCF